MKINLCGKIPPMRGLPLNQTIRVMKLTVILLTIFCMQLSAKVFSQRINLNESNTLFNSVIKTIEKQSGYRFFYDNKLLRPTGRITVVLKNATFEEAMEEVLKGRGLTYSIIDRTVVLRHLDLTLISAPFITFDRVTGRVLDEKNLPMPGVSVKIKDGKTGGITDADGRFQLTAKKGETLVFSYIGYTSKEVVYSGQGSIEVSLSPGSLEMGELVVVGYGTQKKTNLTAQ
jgi:hypothetical protein